MDSERLKYAREMIHHVLVELLPSVLNFNIDRYHDEILAAFSEGMDSFREKLFQIYVREFLNLLRKECETGERKFIDVNVSVFIRGAKCSLCGEEMLLNDTVYVIFNLSPDDVRIEKILCRKCFSSEKDSLSEIRNAELKPFLVDVILSETGYPERE